MFALLENIFYCKTFGSPACKGEASDGQLESCLPAIGIIVSLIIKVDVEIDMGDFYASLLNDSTMYSLILSKSLTILRIESRQEIWAWEEICSKSCDTTLGFVR